MTGDYLIGGYSLADQEVTFNSAQESYQWQLENAGIPLDLAAQVAEIFVKDDPNLPDLGRSEEEQALVQSAHQMIAAQGFFQ
jgi:hypothetical protein